MRGLLVFAAACLVYANTLRNGFVWDDHAVIEANAFLKDSSNLGRILRPDYFLSAQEIQDGARPMVLLSFLLDRALWLEQPAGYHLSNLMLHAACSLLVFLLGLRFLSARAALAAGLLFAVHPVNSEAVNQISFRADLMSTFFVLSALLAYALTRPPSREWEGGAQNFILIAVSGLFYFLGLLSKEMAITFPALALLLDWVLIRRGRPRPSWAWRAAAFCFFAALAAGYAGFRAHYGGYAAIAENLRDAPNAKPAKTAFTPSPPAWSGLYRDPAANLRSMSVAFANYLRLLILPYPLKADRSPPWIASFLDPRLWLSWAVLIAFFCGAFALRTREPLLALAAAWYAITLLPVSNIAPLYNPVAERYLYLVTPGACWLLANLMEKLRWSWLLLLPYAGLTVFRNLDWRSDETLFAAEASRKAENARVYYNLGFLRQQEGAFQEALLNYRRALSLHPRYAEAMTNLGSLYGIMGNEGQSMRWHREAVSLMPKSPVPYDALGSSLEKQGRLQEAIESFRQALAIDHKFTAARMHLAAALAKSGRTTEAIGEYSEAARLDPAQLDAFYNAGMLCDQLGKYVDAAWHLRRALALDSSHADSTMNLGVVYHHQGNLSLARQWLERARKLSPASPAAHYNLGVLMGDLGKNEEAIRSFRKALLLKPDYADAQYNLAVSLHKSGRIPEALGAYRQTLRLDPHKLEALNNLGGLYEMQGRLQEARSLLQDALRLDPRRPSLHNNLGNVYLKEGKIEEAIVQYQKVLEYAPSYDEPSSNLAPTYSNLGVCHYRRGRPQEAIRFWRLAIQADPEYREAKNWLERALKPPPGE